MLPFTKGGVELSLITRLGIGLTSWVLSSLGGLVRLGLASSLLSVAGAVVLGVVG